MNKPHAAASDFRLDSLAEEDLSLPASRETAVLAGRARPTPVEVPPVEVSLNSAAARSAGSVARPAIPEYLSKVYTWAYLTPAYSRYLDTSFVVSAILWGNANRLMRAGFSEFEAGQEVLQPACVYGSFSSKLAAVLGPKGALHVTDVATNQIDACRTKLAAFPSATLDLADAADPRDRSYDGVCCFFLLHEVPEDYKHRIVKSLLDATRPGGKAVFVDYHGPSLLHPLRPIMIVVWRLLEPYALALSDNEIRSYAPPSLAEEFTWHKETYFGGLYQKVVATRKGEGA
ncbi:class I SAM-dependent methyltransferase [Roseospira marina]|uniref:Class I SAM-dependent methyltransferase n=1 Tax=Roseospira marina TaxID=140057 RepID=A0A5M6IEU0_9PROT|nr:rhodoquinone biosynthesis methyltransferase RquA [Roseospira marina]KAA5606632.1 class I SAM-dependent methyltransferase [Roseospira marina]MBB4313963.1 SAM-dependent methyltransferase [Roseospira marina]MBB5087125.1 SAM-dependent methyltransferase [Roseospira marina]